MSSCGDVRRVADDEVERSAGGQRGSRSPWRKRTRSATPCLLRVAGRHGQRVGTHVHRRHPGALCRWATATARLPEPTPTSSDPRLGISLARLRHSMTTCSLSGRGISTAGPTSNSRPKNSFGRRGRRPGSPRRAADQLAVRVRDVVRGGFLVAGVELGCAAAEGVGEQHLGVEPRELDPFSCQVAGGPVEQPPGLADGPGLRRAHGAGGRPGGPSRAFSCRRDAGRLRRLAQGGGDDGVELVERQVDAVVGDAVLREVVGADAVAAVAGADQRCGAARPARCAASAAAARNSRLRRMRMARS